MSDSQVELIHPLYFIRYTLINLFISQTTYKDVASSTLMILFLRDQRIVPQHDFDDPKTRHKDPFEAEIAIDDGARLFPKSMFLFIFSACSPYEISSTYFPCFSFCQSKELCTILSTQKSKENLLRRIQRKIEQKPATVLLFIS